MALDSTPHPASTLSDAAEHVSEARERARQMLGGESHSGAAGDWRQSLVSARDTLLLLWVVWATFAGFGGQPLSGQHLIALAAGLSLLWGLTSARATYLQVEHYTSELQREREEIRNHFDEECLEVRAMYEAKGFQDPVLGEIVKTLSADDDRLLKVMMEEELGLFMHHMNHPLLVGLMNFGASAAVGLALALPVIFLPESTAELRVPIAGAILLAVLSALTALATRRKVAEVFAAGVVMAIVTGGSGYFLARWFAEVTGAPLG